MTEAQQQIAREATDQFCLTHTNVTTRWAKGDLEQAFLSAIERATEAKPKCTTASQDYEAGENWLHEQSVKHQQELEREEKEAAQPQRSEQQEWTELLRRFEKAVHDEASSKDVSSPNCQPMRERNRARVKQARDAINAALAAESQSHKHIKFQLLSALAAIEAHNELADDFDEGRWKINNVDLSLLHQHDAEVRATYISKLEAILKDRSKGEVDTWGFVAMFLDMIKEAGDALAKVKEGE